MSVFFQLIPTVAFDDNLLYKSGARSVTHLCTRDPTHAAEQYWVRPLQLQGPVVPHTDFEWTVYGDLVVSAEVARKLHRAGFTGVFFLDVEFFTTSETPFGRDSFELRVCGWGGVAHPESGIRVIEECRDCGRKVFSHYTNSAKIFNIDAWDGSDFFVIWPLPKYIMVTEAVAEHIREADYSGVETKAIDRLTHHKHVQTLGPGPLGSW